MTPWSIPDLWEFAKSLSLTIDVDMLEARKSQLQKELEEFNNMDEFMKYQTILSKIYILEQTYKYGQDDIARDINYIRWAILWIIAICILLALFN